MADYSGIIVDDVIVAPPEAARSRDRRPVVRRLLRPGGGVFRLAPVRSDPT